MIKKIEQENDVVLSGNIKPADMRDLRARGAIHQLKMSGSPTLTVKLAQALPTLQSVEQLWLWCDVTRKALHHVIKTPGLRVLDILSIKGPGRLEAFADAKRLEIFRANLYLTEEDVAEALQAPSLLELGIQNASLSPRIIAMMLAHPRLEVLDLEATEFDDTMAATLSASQKIHALDLGATKITGPGLAHLCRMTQLKSLDLWATQVTIADLDLLTGLPHLEYLFLGNFEDMPSFDAAELIPKLEALASLKNIWLDGIRLDEEQAARLRARIARVNITCA
ncbi:leucine-rich repeat domain-containing protein [Undibacterium umbellatum]|uniref:Leucine Rich repeats (2 copies) n=1 Tax=Undibacterium umbellatum TaxID=2762300 RepID=A0ABR6ZDI0_9BURK|nr:hypothetical protein [Undibacterium umbellatum]MBC3909684.1 hypothetical protein [Undibacterium umbellatum]